LYGWELAIVGMETGNVLEKNNIEKLTTEQRVAMLGPIIYLTSLVS